MDVRIFEKPKKISREQGLAMIEQQQKLDDNWPFGTDLTCLMQIMPDSPASGFTTPQEYELRDGTVIRKIDGWHRVTRRSWNKFKNLRDGDRGPAWFEAKKDPGAMNLDTLVEAHPLPEEEDEEEILETSDEETPETSGEEADAGETLETSDEETPESSEVEAPKEKTKAKTASSKPTGGLKKGSRSKRK